MRFAGGLFAVLSMLALEAVGFDSTRHDNVVLYWGQNSRGTSYPNETASYQKSISYYCRDNATDVIPIAFLNKSFSTGGLPEINLGNTCSVGTGKFPGTSLANCHGLAADIKACQAKGKLVTLSLGGAGGSVSFTGDAQAQAFAKTVWNLFLGGSSSTRPFGDAVLDGINLDIETGTPTGYAAFIHKIQSLAGGASKNLALSAGPCLSLDDRSAGECVLQYYMTASPQCVYPDATLGGALNTTWFDAVYVQFYDNPCGLQNYYNSTSYWNFGVWDNWARNISPNRNIKIYIGAYGAPGGGGVGYVPISTLKSIAITMRRSYPSFGGVMLWDASQAYANGRYDMAIKKALQAAGGVGFVYPVCSAPAYVSGKAYTVGQNVSYKGYIWQPKWWTNAVPHHNSTGDWNEVCVCYGSPTTRGPLGEEPTYLPTGTKYAVVPGMPTGALANGENTVHRRGYFLGMVYAQVPTLFAFLYLHWCRGFD